jgi:tRNA threonylcarbamoyladenosine biosynthesis protein TsaB
MAKILALDTSTDACSVALEIDGERIETFKIIPRKHTHELLPIIKQILADAQLHINQLDAIAFGRGPGSFAGIRIATGVAQGLAFAADLAAIPVSTLGCLAQGYYRSSGDDKSLIVSAIDARMDEIYWGGYTIEQGVAQLKINEMVSPPSHLLLENSDVSKLVAIGSGYHYLDKMAEELVSTFTHIDNSVYPHALDMLALASREWELGNTVAAEDAQPVYLRNQVAWKKKDQQ